MKYDPDVFWFDTPEKLSVEENLRILRAAREAKPTLVVNGRAVQVAPGRAAGALRRLRLHHRQAGRVPAAPQGFPDWEAIPTTNESYGWHQSDDSHKPPAHFIALLAKAAARGGNVLLNIGPMGTGAFDPKDAAILEGIGDLDEGERRVHPRHHRHAPAGAGLGRVHPQGQHAVPARAAAGRRAGGWSSAD